ncbi:MAG: DUF3089 domain-containing protein [Bacteroidota bacterium]
MAYTTYTPPPAPDYSKTKNWAALPTQKDEADRTPHPDLKDNQATAEVDVFWLHPTTYTKKRGNTEWNAPTDDPELNKITDEGSILNQASIFNGAGKVYAPRYRQAHIHGYYTKDKATAQQAFATAYQDVKAAFEYYLQQYNPVNPKTGKRRPIIIAAHSQGTTHAGNLLKEYFDGKPLGKDLVVAYLVGMPVLENYFKTIKVCTTPEAIGCFCSWRTWKHGHFPKKHKKNNNIAVTNPLTWTTDITPAPKSLNRGAVLRKFEKSFKVNLVDAQVQNGVLWAHKPKFPGSIFITFKNYHIADLNFYYVNIRENAIRRAKAFLAGRA